MTYQSNINVSEISTIKKLMIKNVCIEIINLSSMLHGYRTVVSSMNGLVFSMTTSINHECCQCDLDWARQYAQTDAHIERHRHL